MIKPIAEIAFEKNGADTVGSEKADRKRHYNASMIRWKGKLLMAYRSQGFGLYDISTIKMAYLDEDYLPDMHSVQDLELDPQGNAYEDPRLFVYKGTLWISYSVFNPKTTCAMACAGLCEDQGGFKVAKTHIFEYGNNARNMALISAGASKVGEYELSDTEDLLYEKNWQFFEYEQGLYAVYSIEKHIVLECAIEKGAGNETGRETAKELQGNVQEYISEMPAGWDYGIMRGGTPPIRIGDLYFSFFHSHRKSFTKKKYFIGAYAFEAKPPFQIHSITTKPIMIAQDGKAEYGKGFLRVDLAALFPCGAIFEDGNWKISYGQNDNQILIGEISHEELLESMTDIGYAMHDRSLWHKVWNYINIKVYDLLVDMHLILASAKR